jgi:hypothetical protein
MPVIGFLHAGSAAERTHAVASFQKGLAEADYSRTETWRLNFAGRMVNSTDCRGWQPIWRVARWQSLPPSGTLAASTGRAGM